MFRSRILPIRPRALRRLLTLTALGWILAAAVFGGAARAHADPDTDYAAVNAARICAVLDAYPTTDGVAGIGIAIVNEGRLSFYEAGQAIGLSVATVCPWHQDIIDLFIAKYSSKGGYLA